MSTSFCKLPGKPNYILLDAARMLYRIKEAKELNRDHSSLYKGRIEEELAEVAPYIFTFITEMEFAGWIIEKCWGDACGVLIDSPSSFNEVFMHFQRLLIVQTEEGQELYFRFYDPRVLRAFLPTCDGSQLKEFFGPVERFICEDEDAEYALVFSLQDNNLKTVRVHKDDAFTATAWEQKRCYPDLSI